MLKIPPVIKIYITAILICFILVCYIFYYFSLGYDIRRRKNREEFLREPIPYHITSDLCLKGVVPKSISDCSGEEIFIKRNQSHDIFNYGLKSLRSYDDVQAVFGIYQVFCTQPENSEYYCFYQLEASPGVSIKYEEGTNDIVNWN